MMPQKQSRAKSHTSGLERIAFFSDAVMAIAITLLILEVRLPEAAAEAAVGRQVLALWPKYLGYFVSFWVIALYWVAHHRCFQLIRGYDRGLINLNFLFLMFIAFMPFPTGLLFSHPAQVASVTLYAGTAAGMGLSLWLLWIYAVRRRFLEPGLSRRKIRDIGLNLFLPPLIFVITIGIAFLSTTAAVYAWLLLVPVYGFRRLRERSLAQEI
jgi:uncharacterized membrane protein